VTDVFRMVYAPGREADAGGRPREARCASADAASKAHVPAEAPAASADAAVPRAASAARRRRLIGVIVYSRSPLSLAARNRATGGRYRAAGMGRAAAGHLINRELRIISRVVLTPNWRGLGLASRLVAETLPQVGTPYVEALAAMGRMHPMFERAGMTAYRRPPAPQAERLRAALEAAGIGRADRRSGESLGRAIDALAGPARRLAEAELARWARSYLGAKNHRTAACGRRRMCDLAARHLDSAPVYYLWRNPNL
jgi:hypothetical protein